MVIDSNDTLWSLSEKGISFKPSGSSEYTHLKDSHQWSHISITENGKVWILYNRSLMSFDRDKEKLENEHTFSEDGNDIIALENDLLIIGENNAFIHLNGKIKNTIPFPKHIRSWSNYKNGVVYFSVLNTLYRYTKESSTIDRAHSFPNNITIESILVDSQDQIWVGTDKGLYRENKLAAKFNHEPIRQHARRILKTPKALYLAGNGGLHTISKSEEKSLLKDRDLLSLFMDKDSTIWTGDVLGSLFEIKKDKVVKEHKIDYQKNANPNYMFGIAEDQKGRLWLGTWNGIFIVNKAGKVIDQFKLTVDTVDVNYRVLKVLADKKDRLWIIGPSHGLFKIDNFSDYDPSKKNLSIKNYQRDSNKERTLNTNVIIDIHQDTKGKIWISTDVGINMYNEEQDNFDYLDDKGSLFNEKIMAIEHDLDNKIWLSSITKGLYAYDQNNNSFTHYNKQDGIVSNAFLYTSSELGPKGKLYFGTDAGIQIVDPEIFSSDEEIRRPIITNFSLSDNEKSLTELSQLSYDKEITVHPPHNSFSISFSSLNFSNNTKINYAYKLDGLDQDWRYTKPSLNTAYYTNVSQGDYIFHIKAYNTSLGIESGVETMVKIQVIPPWYRSTTAYIFYALLFIGLIFLLYYLQVQRKFAQITLEQLKKEEENKLQKLIDNFHYLGLSSIFSVNDLDTIKENQSEIYGILSYFATSLFDKFKTEQVLKDITANCISKLHLEDCVIYWLDASKKVLVQKAAHGQKSSDEDESKIVNPIDIPLGKGIVGFVAQSGIPELIDDLSKDERYIVDDKSRQSELAVPIFLKGEVVGVIDSEHSNKGFFTKGHLEIFQLLAILLEKKLSQISDKKTPALTNDNSYFKELKQIMLKQKLYQIPTLSLVDIAEQLNISPGYLSKLINQITDGNFNDFINSFRVHEVQKKLQDPDYSNYSILSIGLESGFNSKSVFYTAFKKQTGLSPSEFRDKS